MKCAIYATDCLWNREKKRVEDLMDRYPCITAVGGEIVKTYTADPSEPEDEDGYTILCDFNTLEDFTKFLHSFEIGEVVISDSVSSTFVDLGVEFELEIYNDYRE